MAGGRSSAKANMMILRQAIRMERGFSKQAGDGWQKRPGSSTNSKNTGDSALWVPHPRTGVYFPEGHEWVMDDLPKHTATLKQTYWLRNVDGVDKPEPDSPPEYCFQQWPVVAYSSKVKKSML